MIKISNLNMSYGTLRKTMALDSISLEIRAGEFVGIVGPNGAGKTTLLKLICHVIRPTIGKIEVSDKVGYVPEVPAVHDYLSANENIRYFSTMLGNNVDPLLLLKYVGLKNDKKYSQNFSKGMKKRLSIALALATGARILVLDEPFEGLDPGMKWDLKDTIQRLNKEGITIILSTHELEEIDQIVDRIIAIDKGNIIEDLEKKSSRLLIRISDNLDEALSALHSKGLSVEREGEYILVSQGMMSTSEIVELAVKVGAKIEEVKIESISNRYKDLFSH